MLPTQELIDYLAGRIERAYRHRRSRWYRGCSTRRVWSAAALCLWQAHVDDPNLPLDCELFVESQGIAETFGDPWEELAQPGAAGRYRARVYRIIRRLRAELKREVRLAGRALEQDSPSSTAVLSVNNRLSALGCYIAAHRAGMPELAARFAADATEQHRSCPLYQIASIPLLSNDLYPFEDSSMCYNAEHVVSSKKKLTVLN